jgi:hypothetical protein
MGTGMLWFDDNPDLDNAAKIRRAELYYLKKYGQKPDVCFVHPSMAGSLTTWSFDMEIQAIQNILPNHFWLGMRENSPVSSG